MWDDKWPFTEVPFVTGSTATGLGDVTNRVRTSIAIECRIRRTANTDRVEYENNCSRHVSFPVFPAGADTRKTQNARRLKSFQLAPCGTTSNRPWFVRSPVHRAIQTAPALGSSDPGAATCIRVAARICVVLACCR
jgi:hypothetical protein